MRNIALAFCGAMLCTVIAPAQPAPDFPGVWRRNPQTHSSGKPLPEMIVRIVQHGDDIAIINRTRNPSGVETNIKHVRIGAASNANVIHGAPMTSKALWDGATLVIDSVAKFDDQELRMNDRWTIAPDSSWEEQAPQTAEQAYPNIEIFKGVPAERIPVIMTTFSRVLGVACTHCHVEGAMEKGDKPAFAKARRMFQMRNWIAQNTKIESTCWSCHRGNATPAPAPPIDASRWPAQLTLSSEQAAQPAAKIYRNLKFFNSIAADVKTSMLSISAALGVECSHCHTPGEWDRDDRPAKDTARRMLAMVRDERREFPDIRIACATCHHGAIKPEQAP